MPKKKATVQTKSVRKSKVPAKVKKVQTFLQEGKSAPSFSLLDEMGVKRTLKEFKGAPLVIYFYPKDDTPGCTKESCDFRDNFARVKAKGIQVLGVSKDSVASHLKFKDKYSLPFTLLSDVECKMCEAYGVWKEKSLYGRKYMGIERTTFIINSSGKIAKIYPKVSVTGHVDQVLADLEGVK